MSKLIEYTKNAICKYGKNGDKSFEFVGINIDNSVQFKTYRKKSEGALAYLENTKPYSFLCELLSLDFLCENKMAICDFSKGKYKNIETYRIVFSINNNQSINEIEGSVNNFFGKVGDISFAQKIICKLRFIQAQLNTNKSLLMHLGIEVDEKCNLIGVKYYVSIKTANDNCTKVQLDELLANISIGKIRISEFKDLLYFFRKQEYIPTFIGFNLYNDEIETKLYFESTAFGFQTKQIVECTNNVFREYNLDRFISTTDITSLFQMDMFVRGIAVDINTFNKWRLYINALPRKMV